MIDTLATALAETVARYEHEVDSTIHCFLERTCNDKKSRMWRVASEVRRCLSDEDGPTAAEYAVMAGFVIAGTNCGHHCVRRRRDCTIQCSES